MATQAELDQEQNRTESRSGASSNADSLSRQRATRSRRSAERAVKDRRKDLLQGASSTKERRQIKAGVYDLDTTRVDDNKQGTDERVANDGIDTITSPLSSDSSGGGGVPAGYEEVLRDYVDDDNTAQQEYYLTKAV